MSNGNIKDVSQRSGSEHKQEANLPPESNVKSPWNPKIFYAVAIFCGFGAAGVLAGINYRRLGKPEWKWPTIGISVLAFVASVVGIILVEGEVPAGVYLVDILPALLLERLQSPHYKKWKERVASARGGGWRIPVVVGLISIALTFAIGFTVVIAMTPWSVQETGDIKPIAIGQEITGNIDSINDMDAYSFEARQGECYVMETSAAPTATPLEGTLLTLWYADGTTILEFNNNSIEWTAETTGIFYVTVENSDFASTGDYTLIIQCVSR